MFSKSVNVTSGSVRSIAFLVCVYKNDNYQHFYEMLDSLQALDIPQGFDSRLYLHVDGVLDVQFIDLINRVSPFKLLISEEPVGLARGLNKLISILSDEDYFFRMDSDDLCHPSRIIQQLTFMDANPDIDFCGGAISEFIGTKKNQVTIRTYPRDDDSIRRQLVKGSPFAHVSICFRASFFSQYGNYPVEYPLNEDIAFWFQALKGGAKGANLNTILVYVRMDSAYSRRTYRKAITEFRVYREVARWSGKSLFYPLSRLIFRLLPVYVVKGIYNSKFRRLFLNK